MAAPSVAQAGWSVGCRAEPIPRCGPPRGADSVALSLGHRFGRQRAIDQGSRLFDAQVVRGTLPTGELRFQARPLAANVQTIDDRAAVGFGSGLGRSQPTSTWPPIPPEAVGGVRWPLS